MDENKKSRKCIIQNVNSRFYHKGNAGLSKYLCDAKVFSEEETKKYIKRNRTGSNGSNKIIFLDTSEGLELLSKEYSRLQDFVSKYEPKVNEAKKGMEKLLSLKR